MERPWLGPVTIEGVAWTGEGKVVIVEVSIDDGQTWEKPGLSARMLPMPGGSGSLSGNPRQAGACTILARATDDHGQTQPMTSPWNPGGFLWNGVDRVQVEVKSA